MKRGKRFTTATDKIDSAQRYSPDEAIALVRETATAKFDETVEMHILTGLDPRHAEQQIRGSTVLPHGLGKEVRIAVFTEGEAAAMQGSRADIVGGDELSSGCRTAFRLRHCHQRRENDGQGGTPRTRSRPPCLMPNPRAGKVGRPRGTSVGPCRGQAGAALVPLDARQLHVATFGKGLPIKRRNSGDIWPPHRGH